jgi:guanine deaminase
MTIGVGSTGSTLASEHAAGAQGVHVFRGDILHFVADPYVKGNKAHQYIPDGGLVVENGIVKETGPFGSMKKKHPRAEIHDYSSRLIVPGFIDTHIHYPQTEMIGAFGEQLLDWLNKYTFPAERRFEDKAHAREVAQFFLSELLSNGTTTALVFATVHPQSADAFFEESEKLNTRMIAGKVMMDRNAPDYLLDTQESAYADTKKLIDKWHKKGRQLYAVTPRFAPTSTPEQLKAASNLLKKYKDVYMHTHLSENQGEVAWVKSLFPESKSYLGVYDDFGLVTDRAIFAHSIFLDDDNFKLLSERGGAIAFCPTSNLFLGSGLFKLNEAERFKVDVGMGTDVGAGTSFSMLQTLNEGYKAIQMHKAYAKDPESKRPLNALKAFYLATLGGAEALEIDDKVGSFRPGREADFVILKHMGTPLLDFRMKRIEDISSEASLAERLFVFMTLGDDRAIEATHIMGKKWLDPRSR